MNRKYKKISTCIEEIRSFAVGRNKRILSVLIMKNLLIIVALAYLFYDNVIYSLALFPFFIILFISDIRKEKQKESDRLLMQFQDMLSIMSQNLQAGSSVENAFIQSEAELRKIYDVSSVFMISMKKIVNGLRVNIPIEKLVNMMSEQLQEDEICTFATVFSAAKRSGGNLVDIISFTVNTIMEKIRIQRETNMIISSKKMEQSIMSIIPMAILLYVKTCCGDFIDGLYHNLTGVVIMSIFIVLYAIAYIWSQSIMKIEV